MIRFPRSKLGWTRLFWITIRRCPKCHGALIQDPWRPWDNTLFCMPCGGGMYPNGFWHTLASNYRAEKISKEIKV